MRPVMIFLAVISICGCPADRGGPPSTPCTRPADDSAQLPAELKVVTFNVQGCRAGIERVIELLRGQQADVIFLQEVGRGGQQTEDQAARIAKSLGGVHYVSASTLGVPADQHCDQAILSRFKLAGAAFHCVERGGWVYAIQATVEASPRPLHLLSVHTRSTSLLEAKCVIESSSTRLAQVTKLLDVVRKLDGDVIMAGDFNATPWMPEYVGLTSVMVDFGARRRDAATMFTFPSHQPMLRLDYVFGRGSFACRSYRVLPDRCSDHLAVVAELARQ